MNVQQSHPFQSHLLSTGVLTTLAQNLKLLKPERERSREKKSKNRRLNASNNRPKKACIIFRSLGGEPVELCYEPDIYGIQQIDSVNEQTLLLFTSKTDKACEWMAKTLLIISAE